MKSVLLAVSPSFQPGGETPLLPKCENIPFFFTRLHLKSDRCGHKK